MTPVAACALGFDPTMSWQYVLAVGGLPLLLAVPAIFQVGLLFELLSLNFFRYEGPADLAERIGLILIVAAISVATYSAVSHWIHAPVTTADHLMLAAASPFIGGITVGVVVLAGVLVGASIPRKKQVRDT